METKKYRIIKATIMGAPVEQIERVQPYGAIPKDINNCDYKKYLKWLEEGNTPDVVDKQ